MGNSPSIPGLGGRRPHVRRDHGYVDSDRGWRPEQTQTRDTDIEEDEDIEKGVDIVNVPEIYVGHNIHGYIHGYSHGYPRKKSVDMDVDMDGKFHIHGKPDNVIAR